MYLLLVILITLVVVSIERILFLALGANPWRLRLAFLAGAALPLALHVVGPGWLPGNNFGFLPSFCAILLGAFGGGLAVTALQSGWWEDNSPPSAQVAQEVHQIHLQRIGVPGPTVRTKRLFDLLAALLGLLVLSPVWLLAALLVWLEDPAPVLFVKNSVGKGGANFHQFKLRSMVHGAEEHTGPVLAQEQDERVLWMGRLLRKTALDELPQLINILRGEMSFVGPRPQRTVLVHQYLQELPEYAERHRVLPGLAGLAQVAGDYYLTPQQKLRFDRLYIRHASLGFDIKLVCLACLITFWYRWKKNWNGRLPRRLLRLGSPFSRASARPARTPG